MALIWYQVVATSTKIPKALKTRKKRKEKKEKEKVIGLERWPSPN